MFKAAKLRQYFGIDKKSSPTKRYTKHPKTAENQAYIPNVNRFVYIKSRFHTKKEGYPLSVGRPPFTFTLLPYPEFEAARVGFTNTPLERGQGVCSPLHINHRRSSPDGHNS
jgi:hypothetical protein